MKVFTVLQEAWEIVDRHSGDCGKHTLPWIDNSGESTGNNLILQVKMEIAGAWGHKEKGEKIF